MASSKVSALTTVSSLADTDYVYVVYNVASTPVSRAIQYIDLVGHKPTYAELYTVAIDTHTVSTASTYELFGPWDTAGAYSNITASVTDSAITLTNTGTYEVSYYLSAGLSGATDSVVISTTLMLAGAYTANGKANANVDPAADPVTVQASAILVNNTVGATLSVWLTSDAVSTIETSEGGLIAKRID